jgi:hypothetical protein
MISQDEFATTDSRSLYARMRPDQRTAIANEFIRLLRLSGDFAVADFADDDQVRLRRAGHLEMAKQGFDAQPPQLEPADEVASIHAYTREHHPDIFEQVAHHPVTLASLANPGARMDEAVQKEDVIVQAPPSAVEENDPDLHKTASLFAADSERGLAQERAEEVLHAPDRENLVTDPSGHQVLDEAQEERL